MSRTNEEMDQALISAASQQKLGPAPGQPQQPQQDPASQETPPSLDEQAQEAIAPETEGDMSREDAFVEVDFGNGDKRTLSTSQIKSTMERYRDMNYRHANEIKPIEPAINLINQMVANARQTGQEVNGEDVAQFLASAIQAYTSNPQMGNQQDPTPDRPDGQSSQIDEEIARWERENAVTLPPQYRQGMQLINQLQMENSQMKQMMSGILAQAQGVNGDAQVAVNQAQQDVSNAYRMQAANNLNSAQAEFNLPDEAEDDFFDFAYGRGYTVEDFVDRDLTRRIMQDFAANRNTPEMERLRALNERRQAFTGAGPSTPTSGAAPAGNPDEQFMNSVAQQAMRKRGLA